MVYMILVMLIVWTSLIMTVIIKRRMKLNLKK